MQSNNFEAVREAIKLNPEILLHELLEMLEANFWYSPTNKKWMIYHPDFKTGTISNKSLWEALVEAIDKNIIV
jgi:hypothetical protein